MKKITIFVIVVLLLAVTAVPAFAHPAASDDGVGTAVGAADPSPSKNDGRDANGSPTAQDNIVDNNPICGGHPATH